VRQLENAIFRAVVLADDDEVGVNEFPQVSAQFGETGDSVQPLPEPAPAMAAALPDISEETGGDGAPVLTLPRHVLHLTDAQGEVRTLDEIESEVIRFAINHYRGQMSEVARRLKIGRSTLYRKLESLDVDDTSRTGKERTPAE